jgi:hypothetical protein
MINRPHSPQRRALLPIILALTLLAGCSLAFERTSLTLNPEAGEAIADNKLGGTPPPLDPKHLPFSPEHAWFMWSSG